MRSCSTGSRFEPPDRMSATASSNQPSYRSAASSQAARFAACMSRDVRGLLGRRGRGRWAWAERDRPWAASLRGRNHEGRRPADDGRSVVPGPGAEPAPCRQAVAGSWPGPPSSAGAGVAREVARAGDGRHVRSSARCVFARGQLARHLPAPLRAVPWGRSHRHVRDLRGPPRGGGGLTPRIIPPLATSVASGRIRRSAASAALEPQRRWRSCPPARPEP